MRAILPGQGFGGLSRISEFFPGAEDAGEEVDGGGQVVKTFLVEMLASRAAGDTVDAEGDEMRLSEDVKPVDELEKGGVQLVRSIAESRRTVLLTDSGTAKAVLMDVASYDRWRDTVALLKLIAQSEADLEARRTVSHDEAFARAERAIAEFEQAG